MANFEWVAPTVGAGAVLPQYLKALGLDRHPFPVAPDDAHFYTSAYIEQVVAEIVHGIEARKGFMVISGDVGLGKTTVTRRILQILERNQVCTSLVFHTSLKDVDLLREINRDFGIPAPESGTASTTLGDELQRLNTFLTVQYRLGKNCAIIIDDAQNLDRSSLELVRMISNLEADCHKVVQILLVGQPELMANLSKSELRQLKSRIFLNKLVRPLDLDELRTYILFKLSQAGSQGRIVITPKAFKLLHRVTRGNFRHINLLMDRCLYQLCSDGGHCIDARHVRLAQADLGRKAEERRWRLPSPVLSLAVPALLVLSAWVIHLEIRQNTPAPGMVYAKTNVERPSSPTDGVGTINAALTAESGDDEVDPAVAAFLRSSHLGAYAVEFERAWSQGHLGAWAEQIFRQQGLQLVQLPALTDPIRRRYGALALPAKDAGHVDWLLFWRPDLEISKFYYGYQGPEISRLQRLLTVAGEYHQEIDGRVDADVMAGIVAFQTRSGLAITGLPDAATLFTLCQLEGPSQ